MFSPADVHAIRRYVQTRLASSSAENHAEIVASAIRQTIRRRLPEWPDPMRDRIADVLIRRCLVDQRREIKPEDVLDACSEMMPAAMDPKPLIVMPMLQWLNERAPGQWDESRVFRRLCLTPAQAANFRSLPDLSTAEDEVPAKSPNPASPKPLAARIPWTAWLLGSLALAGGIIVGVQFDRFERQAPVPISPPVSTLQPKQQADIGMPQIFRYRTIDSAAVKDYLKKRDSILADEPYFGAIVDQAEAFDVNPLLLFAITGQEQGFVPRTAKNADRIANNPFNVFHSWEKFNTDIAHSAEIAARTVSRRAALRPEGHDPFVWLNMTYAEDPNWANGVRQIFDKLSNLQNSSIRKP